MKLPSSWPPALKITIALGATGLALLAVFAVITKHIILPRYQHKVPTQIGTIDRNATVLPISFKPLSWQEALNTTTTQFFQYRKPLGVIMSNTPEFTYAPQETFSPNNLHAREDTSITVGTPYRPYFGNLHAHTGWSDGKGDPSIAFAYARDVGHMDFMAVTDHPEHWIFNSDRKWSDLVNIAKVFTTPHFVAIPGFEYSSPIFGHYVVINPKGVCSAMRCAKLNEFYDWLSGPEADGSFAFFAHPLQQRDNATAYEFGLFSAHEGARQRIKGIEVIHWSGYRGFLDGFSGNKPFIDEAIQNGWEVGSISSQDNHGPNWGTGGTNRLVLLMDKLAPETVMDALQSRRFYATSSKNLYFTAQAQVENGKWLQMGEEVAFSPDQYKTIKLYARFFEPDEDLVPHKFEWVVNGKVVAAFDFFSQENFDGYMNSKHYYAGEFSFELSTDTLRKEDLNYVYARFYQNSNMDAFTQSSPIFFRGSQYRPPASVAPKAPW